MRSVVCRICRCRLVRSTTSESTMPRVPTPAGAVEDGRLLFFGKPIFSPLFQVALRYVHRPRDVAGIPLVFLANVAELDLARADQLLDLLGRGLGDALFDVGEVVAICRHSSSLVDNPKPTPAVGNSRYARIPRWRRSLSTCSSSSTTWRSRSLSADRSCSGRRSRPRSSDRPGVAAQRARYSEASSRDSMGSRSSR